MFRQVLCSHPLSAKLLLHGCAGLTFEDNVKMFKSVKTFIKETGDSTDNAAMLLPNGPPEYVIIRDYGDSELNDEDIENELERALEQKAEIIVIEPVNIGEETARWIKVGNVLHKTAVLSGSTCLIGEAVDEKRDYLYFSCGMFSIVCASIYYFSWQHDPCCKYQVEDNVQKLETLLHSVSSATPIVLVRKDDSRRKTLHNLIAILSGFVCAWRMYNWIKS